MRFANQEVARNSRGGKAERGHVGPNASLVLLGDVKRGIF